MKLVPLSIMIFDGILNLTIIFLVKNLMIEGPLEDLSGIASTHYMKYSIAMIITLYPSLDLVLITPMRSKAQIENRQVETIV